MESPFYPAERDEKVWVTMHAENKIIRLACLPSLMDFLTLNKKELATGMFDAMRSILLFCWVLIIQLSMSVQLGLGYCGELKPKLKNNKTYHCFS